jgi:hypothetical protein
VPEVVLDVGDHDLGAVPDELDGGRLADAARSPGDDGYLSGQPKNKIIPPLFTID